MDLKSDESDKDEENIFGFYVNRQHDKQEGESCKVAWNGYMGIPR